MGVRSEPEGYHDSLGAAHRVRVEVDREITLVKAIAIAQWEGLAVHIHALLPQLFNRLVA
jgi:hypothetical protein